jgi:hypothetical protein
MDSRLVGLPINVISWSYSGHEYLHHDVNNLSASREFDIEPNKMTLIDLSRCILCACIIRRLVVPQQLEVQVPETSAWHLSSCPVGSLRATVH